MSMCQGIKNLLVLGLCAVVLSALSPMARAQSAGATSELDAILFVQSLPTKSGQDAIHLVWVPQPIQRLCLGKTAQQCATIDYCIRTTNPDSSQCRNLGIAHSSLPSYPPDMHPRRQLSITYFALSGDRFAKLQDFFRRAPRASLERLSLSARVKARIRLIRKPDDDDFDVLEILAVPPF